MSNFFDQLGAAARRTADKVGNQVSIAAQEQKVREAYQALGKVCYRLAKNDGAPAGAEFEAAMARTEAALEALRALKDRDHVDDTVTEEDFA